MGAREYEIAKEYEVSGIKVFSEIVTDQDSAEIIDALELQADGTHFYQEIAGQTKRIPLFKAKISFGHSSTETRVAPSNHGSPPLILGGDFFQKAMRGQENVIQELIMPDHY